ncbi:hypothetical protein [Atopococcus tabaci]|uniref:hypothetical protein n=1 Tax=Atopococcus tabaci TaxID=269774 RepID=UPI0024099076|nr:hypothetical protein [Atopococcus tabaci]
MSLIERIQAYLETYYPQLVEMVGEDGGHYFEHRCLFGHHPSLVAVTVDRKVQTITLQVMIGKYFDRQESELDIYRTVNELNKDYKFASVSEIEGALNLEYHLLVDSSGEEIPPIIEHLLLLTAAANDITGANVSFDFALDE